MRRSAKKGFFVEDALMKKIEAMNAKNEKNVVQNSTAPIHKGM